MKNCGDHKGSSLHLAKPEGTGGLFVAGGEKLVHAKDVCYRGKKEIA